MVCSMQLLFTVTVYSSCMYLQLLVVVLLLILLLYTLMLLMLLVSLLILDDGGIDTDLIDDGIIYIIASIFGGDVACLLHV